MQVHETLMRPCRTPQQAMLDSLAAAQRRFPAGQRVRHMIDRREAEVVRVEARGLDIWVVVATETGVADSLAGEWERASL